MRKTEEVLAYARRQAEALREDMAWRNSGDGDGYWTAVNHVALPKILARAAEAIDFLRRFAGADSFWTRGADEVFRTGGNNQSRASGARAIGDFLTGWADQVEAGFAEIDGAEARREFAIANTDLMAQVRQLLEDRATHPAAPIVLCGAALELALRTVVQVRGLMSPARPSLSAYTELLRREALITAQDVKDIQACGGLRNSAAHGQLEELSLERANLMEQMTNMLLRRLADLHTVEPDEPAARN